MSALATESLRALLTPEAVRERCGEVLEAGLAGRLEHFKIDLDRLDDAVARVAEEIARNYPQGAVPLHSRWRHFAFGERDLWREIDAAQGGWDAAERARARIDLAAVSVLLDAGAGADWRFHDAATGMTLGRSEGLALASLRFFAAGGASAAAAEEPLRADAERLQRLDAQAIGGAFQVSEANPLVGLEARAALLRALGAALGAHPAVYAREGAIRPGHLYDHFAERAAKGALGARDVLVVLLETLGSIWPSGLVVGGIALGDAGRHPAVRRADSSDFLVPFHKLSQWLAYSLIEPLRDAGLAVTDLDALTGLGEYRNGGLLLDCGVLGLREPGRARERLGVDSPLVVEWRALTVALLDRLALDLRRRLGADRESLPLGAVLQGGTWSAGRRIARERRADGAPPLSIERDGTIF